MASPPPIQYDVSTLPVEDFFGYVPSLALAATAMGLFLLAGITVGAQSGVYNGRRGGSPARYTYLLSFSGLCEACGYAAIIYCIQRSGEANIYGSYVASQVFIVLTPNLLQAVNYITLGNLLRGSGLAETRRWLAPGAVKGSFISADVLALLVQAAGITIWATSKGSGTPDPNKIFIGSAVTLAGLAFQLASFAVFAILTIYVQRHADNVLRGERGTGATFAGLYLTIACVTVRNIFRFVEFLQTTLLDFPAPPGTYIIADQQVLFYCLDALPIFCAFCFYVLLHPARTLPTPAEAVAAGARAAGAAAVAAAEGGGK